MERIQKQHYGKQENYLISDFKDAKFQRFSPLKFEIIPRQV